MPKILALDNLSGEGVALFRNTDEFVVDEMPPQSPEDLSRIINGYDGLVVRSGTKVTAEVLSAAHNLKVIGRAGVGTDNIDKKAATNAGIVVMNTPGGNTVSTCEHTFALLLALCRNIPKAHASMEAGRWDRKLFMGAELHGKTLGVVGVGRIGGAVAKRAQAFEMKVIAFDPILTRLKADALGVELVDIDELIERSDFITIHVPKTEKTENMFGAEEFKRMKSTARIVNCARGGIINEQELAQALHNKQIAGAALDVYTSEPFENNPFIGLDNVVMTPHLAASTDEAQLTVAVDVAQQMIDYLTTGAIVNAVNVPSLDSEARKRLEPMLFLANKLGRFLSLYHEGRPIGLDIDYSGDPGVTDTYPITSAVLAGFLEPKVETVNMVSAPSLMRDHGISVRETRSPEESDYAFQIRAKVETDKEAVTVAGTLFGDDDPRICGIDGTRMDAEPRGWVVVCRNDDKPLVIGRVTTVIGEAGVNIANMTLGRDEAGGHAITLLNLDGPLDEPVLEQLRRVPHVNEVRLVNL